MQTKTIQEELCSLSLERGSQQHLFYLLAQFLGILLSLLPFAKNPPFIRPPNSFIIVW